MFLEEDLVFGSQWSGAGVQQIRTVLHSLVTVLGSGAPDIQSHGCEQARQRVLVKKAAPAGLRILPNCLDCSAEIGRAASISRHTHNYRAGEEPSRLEEENYSIMTPC